MKRSGYETSLSEGQRALIILPSGLVIFFFWKLDCISFFKGIIARRVISPTDIVSKTVPKLMDLVSIIRRKGSDKKV